MGALPGRYGRQCAGAAASARSCASHHGGLERAGSNHLGIQYALASDFCWAEATTLALAVYGILAQRCRCGACVFEPMGDFVYALLRFCLMRHSRTAHLAACTASGQAAQRTPQVSAVSSYCLWMAADFSGLELRSCTRRPLRWHLGREPSRHNSGICRRDGVCNRATDITRIQWNASAMERRVDVLVARAAQRWMPPASINGTT